MFSKTKNYKKKIKTLSSTLLTFLIVFSSIFPAGIAFAGELVTEGENPNIDIQLPDDLSNNTGITGEQIQKESPQNDFVFSGDLVGYIDPNNQGKAIIWAPPASQTDVLDLTEDIITPSLIVSPTTTTQPTITSSFLNIYCPDGDNLSYGKFIEAKNAGLINFSIAVNANLDSAVVNFLNQTGCSVPMSLSAYKVFVNPGEQNWLSTQQLFDNTGIINATSLTIYKVNLPNCKAQIDLWYGLAPTTLLDSNPYGGPTPPVVVDWKFTDNNLCSNIPENTPPSITLLGANPFDIIVGNVFTDPGATATDTEDGNLTSQIIKTGAVDASTTGSYILTYSVTDSGGLLASTTRTVNVINMYLPKMPSCNGNFGKVTSSVDSWGFHISDIPKNYIWYGQNKPSHGDTLDNSWVWSGSVGRNIEWDLDQSTQKVRVYPSQDHGGYPAEFNEYDVQVSLDNITWVSASSTAIYVDDISNVRVHDGVQDFTSPNEFRYVRIAPNTIGGGDYEIDAAQACVKNIPPANTPPSITLLGANPFNLTVNTLFVDPGATATDLEDGNATTTSHIIVSGTVNASTTGAYILTYSVTDSGGLSASTTRNVIVSATTTPPIDPPINLPVNPPDGPSGGGGSTGGRRHPVVVGEILGATSCLYLRDHLKIDWNNDSIEVLKLQSFLNVFEKENLSLTGIFDQATFEAVQRFQIKYKEDILKPWGDKVTTGFVYILTKKKVNEIYCNSPLSVTQAEQNEIDTFRNMTESNLNAGASGQVGSLSSPGGVSISDNIRGIQGVPKDNVLNDSPIVELKDNSLSQSAVKNVAISLFALPQKIFSNWKYFLAFIILLAIAVAIIRFFIGSKENLNDDSNSDNNFVMPSAEEVPITEIPVEKEESPVIILPSANILPDEEIVVENPEENPEEDIITTPDLRNENKTN